SVAVDVDQVHRMQFGKLYAVLVVLRTFTHNQPPLERAIGKLAVPGQSKAMRSKARNDVVASIAVNVVGVHLRAAWSAECHLVLFPARIPSQRWRLLPPSALFENIEPPVFVEVTRSHPVCEASSGSAIRVRMKGPWLFRGVPVGGRVA